MSAFEKPETRPKERKPSPFAAWDESFKPLIRGFGAIAEAMDCTCTA